MNSYKTGKNIFMARFLLLYMYIFWSRKYIGVPINHVDIEGEGWISQMSILLHTYALFCKMDHKGGEEGPKTVNVVYGWPHSNIVWFCHLDTAFHILSSKRIICSQPAKRLDIAPNHKFCINLKGLFSSLELKYPIKILVNRCWIRKFKQMISKVLNLNLSFGIYTFSYRNGAIFFWKMTQKEPRA